MLRGVDASKEILVTRADHNDYQIGGKGEVDEREDANDNIRRRGGRDLHDKISELEDKFVDQRRETEDQA